MKLHASAAVVLAVAALAAAEPALPGQGQLVAIGGEGKALGQVPLKHTDVQASISGMMAYVQVTQEFENPYTDKIEAVYTFPLGANAAVSEMTMTIGDRVIVGKIKPREQARQIYEEAKAAGHVASLLDQERPNIFTQAVANIEPGKKITISIGYTETLDYEAGQYEFVFPMVVGPRFIPGQQPPYNPDDPVPGPRPLLRGAPGAPAAPAGGAAAPAAEPAEKIGEKPADADRLNPPIVPKGTRAGHDISITVYLNGGVPIQAIDSKLHNIDIDWPNAKHTRATVTLTKKDEIPNKDFVLSFTTASEKIEDALLTHTRDDKGGYFMLVLQPPAKPTEAQIVPRQLMFVIDTSGSQQGFPLTLSQAICKRAIENLRDGDSFNVMRFANSAEMLFDEYVGPSEANRKKAIEFVEGLKASGGTQMATAMNACLKGAAPEGKVRIVAFFTDGYVGNDMEMIDIVRKNAGSTRVFSFGTGKSVNRYCLDGIAQAGRGEVEYVLSDQGAEKKADRFYERIDKPVLTDISIDWGDLAQHVEADEVYPRAIPDLFSVRPVVLKGRFTRPEKDVTGTITLRGTDAKGTFERKVKVTLPAKDPSNSVLDQQWARAKVEHLMGTDLRGIQQGNPDEKLKEQIVALGVDYGLMTRFTSFVAVEESTVTIGGEARKVEVPVEMPEGVSYEGIFGEGGPQGGMVGGGRGRGGPAPAGMMLARQAKAGNAPAAPPARTPRPEAARADQADDDGAVFEAEALTPADREKIKLERALAKPLQELEKKLDDKGNYRQGNLIVADGKVTVAVYLTRLDDAARDQLKKLGFEKLLESAPTKMVLGTVEVGKLKELALLDVVRLVDLPDLGK